MLTVLLVLLQAAGPAAPPPGERAVALGRQVAETGTLGSLLPMIEAKEIDELVAAHPELYSPEQAALRATAHRVARAGVERLFEAEARAYAGAMTEGELRAVVEWQTGPAARALRPARRDRRRSGGDGGDGLPEGRAGRVLPRHGQGMRDGEVGGDRRGRSAKVARSGDV